MQQVDLVAHPCNSRSYDDELIEAMALVLPVLAAASSVPQDIAIPDVERLTPVGDVRS